MLCNCGELCFSYERITKTENNEILKEMVYKCKTLGSSKREKCDYIKIEILKKEKCDVIEPVIVCKNKSQDKDKLKDLYKYINLYEACKNKQITNIESLINYHLKINDYDLFFKEKETIENLKDRVKKNIKVIKPPDITIKSLVLLKIPSELNVNVLPEKRKKKDNTYHFSAGCSKFKYEEESENEEDNYFDVDNFSDEDEESHEEYFN